jgi:hypothetical protein
LISYEVVSLQPFCIEECNVGSGAACGAVFLNKGFEELLRKKFGGRGESILTPKRLADAVRFFEGSIKVAFNPYDDWSENEYDVPLGVMDDIPEIGLDDGYLKLTKFVGSLAFLMLLGKIWRVFFYPSLIKSTTSSVNKFMMWRLSMAEE